MNTKRIIASSILLTFFCYLGSVNSFAVNPNVITPQLAQDKSDAFNNKIDSINNQRRAFSPNDITARLEKDKSDAFNNKIDSINTQRNHKPIFPINITNQLEQNKADDFNNKIDSINTQRNHKPIFPINITNQLEQNKADDFNNKIDSINDQRGAFSPNDITARLEQGKSDAFNNKIDSINNQRGAFSPNDITARLEQGKSDAFNNKIDSINNQRGGGGTPGNLPKKFKLPLSKFAMSAGIEADFIEPGISARLFYGFGNAKIHGLGVYYKLNSNLKTGLGFIYGQGKADLDKNPSSGDPITNGQIKQNMPAGFADIVYNFIQAPTIFSPYLGVRLGYAKHTLKFLEDNKEILPSETFNGILYGLKLGVELNISDRIAIDLAYIGNSFGSKETNYFEKQKLSHSAAAIIKVSL
jgi:hypothetical protein